MNRKITIMLISFICAVFVFVAIIVLQNKILNPNGKEEVYFAKKYISQNTIITKSNISSYFNKKSVSKDNLIDSPAIEEYQIIQKYVKNDIIKGEEISTKKLDYVSKRLKSIQNLREYSLKFDDISQVVGGILREGDVIDLILTQNASGNSEHKTLTETELKSVVISKAFTADGKRISRENSDNYTATVLNLYISAEDAHKLDNEISQGKVKAIKVLDNSKYQNIKIEN